MKKGISLFFGFSLPAEERVQMIKDAGFDCIITSADTKYNKQNGKIKKQVELFKKYGLKLSSLHGRYRQEQLPLFWEKGKAGNKIEREIKKDVKIAHKYGFTCVVLHCRGEFSSIGQKRFERILNLCTKLNTPIAIENLLSNKIFFDIFKNIEHPYLKFCYDSGHDNCDQENVDYFKLLGNKLTTLHLHDNDGKSDQHTLNKVGTIDWAKLAKKFKKYTPDINLDYEIIYLANCKDMTAKEVLREVKQQADQLESMITKG